MWIVQSIKLEVTQQETHRNYRYVVQLDLNDAMSFTSIDMSVN